tara:strand:+ start:65 stop:877 length:813 start_codon:yes stop_codon:yes gene_type:complete
MRLLRFVNKITPQDNQMLKTPLRCPDQFVSTEFIKDKIPIDCKINSFALGAGTIELSLIDSGYDITVCSNLYYVWEFWKCLITDPYKLFHNIEYNHKTLNSNDLAFYRNNWTRKFDSPFQRAALFYLFNRYSEDGDFTSSELSKHNFSPLNIRSLENFIESSANINLKLDRSLDFTDSIKLLPSENILIIPVGRCKNTILKPRASTSPNKYFFNHKNLREHIDNREQKILLIYKYNDYVDKMYNDKVYINKFGKATENRDLAEDMIVVNF